MRYKLLLMAALPLVALACTTGSGDQITPSVDIASVTPVPTAASTWTPDAVIGEIAAQLFAVSSRPAHIFGLNVESGEEFVVSGRDLLPTPPDTTGWRAEYEGDGVWVVDTGELIYRFVEGDMSFEVIYRYGDR